MRQKQSVNLSGMRYNVCEQQTMIQCGDTVFRHSILHTRYLLFIFSAQKHTEIMLPLYVIIRDVRAP